MIAIYYAGCAIAVFAAFQSLPLSAANYHQHIYRAYLFLCAFAAIFLFGTAQLLSATSLAAAGNLAKWQGLGGIGFTTAFVWLMATYTETQYDRKVQIGLVTFTLFNAGLLAYSLTLPYGLFVDNLQMQGNIHRFGSDIVHFSYDYRPQSAVFQLLGYISILWGAWCCRLLWRRDNHFAAALFGSYLLLLAIAYSLQLLYNFGYIAFALPGGTSFLWLFIVISLCFGRDHQTLINELNQRSKDLSSEVEKRRRAELTIKRQAFTDELTALPNQLALRSRFPELQAQANCKLHLILIQLDRFREIKQVFSETNSDNILFQVAARLKQDMPNYLLVSRISEHCFAVLTAREEGYDLDRNTGIGNWQTDCKLTAPYLAGYQYVEITFSAGIIDTTEEDTAQSALYKAEHALDRATLLSSDSIVYYSETFAQEIAKQQVLESDLKNAIAQGALSLHYQPLIDAQKKIEGAEALLRWHHPEFGMIPPAVFIPLAERSGLMTTIGAWVLEESCRQINAWRQVDGPFRGRISLNVSPWQLQTGDFADTVLALLARYDVSPHWLALELTESALVDNFDLTRRQLEQLRSAGIRIALDDFGTGFSSLAYLSRLPLDTLKIDKSFVDDVTTDERGRDLLASMINIGDALKLKVVLEGVESEAQFKALQSLGCKHYQGYLFSRPLPPDEILVWALEFERASAPV